MFKKLCVIGVGLIGGSIACAARNRHLCQNIVGFGREQDVENLLLAKRLGVINDYFLDIDSALQEADCIVIATPVGAVKSILQLLAPYWNSQAVYTDVGSTKGSIIHALEAIFGNVPGNFVAAHPIAGAEQSGVAAAKADLFQNKRLIITPLATTDPQAIDKINHFWSQLGAKISLMDVEHHDSVLAETSHLPHLLAFALVDLLGRKDEQQEIFQYAAGGFRDFTRIASSDPRMWADICQANRGKIVPLLRQLESELESIAGVLEANNDQQLFDIFNYARNARQRFLDQYE